jgi:hypothetical protein
MEPIINYNHQTLTTFIHLVIMLFQFWAEVKCSFVYLITILDFSVYLLCVLPSNANIPEFLLGKGFLETGLADLS